MPLEKTCRVGSSLVISSNEEAKVEKFDRLAEETIGATKLEKEEQGGTIETQGDTPTQEVPTIVEVGDDSSSLETNETNEHLGSPLKEQSISSLQVNPFSSKPKSSPPIIRKLFFEDLISATKVTSVESWLENTLEYKRKRVEQGPPSGEMF